MLTFLRTHWLMLAGGLVYTLVTLGTAFYFVHSAGQESKAALAKTGVELKAAVEAADKAKQEAGQAKLAWDKEKLISAGLKTKLAEAEKKVSDLQGSVATISEALTKATKAKPVEAKVTTTRAAPVVIARCKDNDSQALRDQRVELQAQQADIYRRETELAEKQKKLDESMSDLAAERRKLNLDKAEYRWPHNGSQGTK